MGKLVSIATMLAFMAVASGNLPRILLQVRKAQIQLIKNSQASKWPKAMTLPSPLKKLLRSFFKFIFAFLGAEIIFFCL
jgi:hypothetical protein